MPEVLLCICHGTAIIHQVMYIAGMGWFLYVLNDAVKRLGYNASNAWIFHSRVLKIRKLPPSAAPRRINSDRSSTQCALKQNDVRCPW